MLNKCEKILKFVSLINNFKNIIAKCHKSMNKIQEECKGSIYYGKGIIIYNKKII